MSIWEQQLKNPVEFILLETSDFLLKEDGSDLVLDQTGSSTSLWETPTKN